MPTLHAAVRAGDVAGVRELLARGANPRRYERGETALHLAARRGPLALVESLIAGGALPWQTDRRGRNACDVARTGRSADRAAILNLLDRPVIDDPAFRAAVDAIHTGDAARLARLIDAEPRLVRERILEPACYRAAQRHDYFRDPKLFWFVANNPTLVERLPPTIVEVARVMIDRGVEPADLTYTLELVMSGGREPDAQRPLMELLLAAGATATPDGIATAAAHGQRDALRALLDAGVPMTAPLAAALGETAALRALLGAAGEGERQTAFALAVINRRLDAARLCLDAGADPSAPLAVHAHSTALHQAAANDDAALIALLIARGARTDVADTLWNATPLGWAIHSGNAAARTALERRP